MLTRLSVNNFALIRNLEIDFCNSFSVITGETGAGKSIILGALSMILGNRADNLSFADANKKCSIEGTFDISKCELEGFFGENNLDYDSQCIIRREITPQGKSRAFINDTPVNLLQLKDLTSRLIDVHSQHQTLLLRENSFQMSVVDAVADNKSLLGKYKQCYKGHQALKHQLEELTARNQSAKAELDYLNFVVDELQKANLVAGEQESLEEELETLTHAEDIKTKLFNASELLSNDEDNIIRRLKEVNSYLSSASVHHHESKNLAERVSSCIIELRDIAEVTLQTVDSINYSPERIEIINDRLDLFYKLQQKHNVKDNSELIELFNNLDLKIAGIISLDDQVEKLQNSIKESLAGLNTLADELSQRRKKAALSIEKSIVDTVAQLGIKEARFIIHWEKLEQPGRDGKDEIKFLFSANKGGTPDDIAKVASGGELSRLMLAVKALVSTNNLLPTIVFDEIDTGISGDIAGMVGNILKDISKNMQVIAITHLPQIAALSTEHFKVMKLTDDSSTYSEIRKLNKDEQIDELALMISGKSSSLAARQAAAELIQSIN